MIYINKLLIVYTDGDKGWGRRGNSCIITLGDDTHLTARYNPNFGQIHQINSYLMQFGSWWDHENRSSHSIKKGYFSIFLPLIDRIEETNMGRITNFDFKSFIDSFSVFLSWISSIRTLLLVLKVQILNF